MHKIPIMDLHTYWQATLHRTYVDGEFFYKLDTFMTHKQGFRANDITVDLGTGHDVIEFHLHANKDLGYGFDVCRMEGILHIIKLALEEIKDMVHNGPTLKNDAVKRTFAKRWNDRALEEHCIPMNHAQNRLERFYASGTFDRNRDRIKVCVPPEMQDRAKLLKLSARYRDDGKMQGNSHSFSVQLH